MELIMPLLFSGPIPNSFKTIHITHYRNISHSLRAAIFIMPSINSQTGQSPPTYLWTNDRQLHHKYTSTNVSFPPGALKRNLGSIFSFVCTYCQLWSNGISNCSGDIAVKLSKPGITFQRTKFKFQQSFAIYLEFKKLQ